MLQISVVLFAFMKLLNLLRIFEKFGQLVSLIGTCISDMKIFMIFLSLFVNLFQILYILSGAEFSADDYPDLSPPMVNAF